MLALPVGKGAVRPKRRSSSISYEQSSWQNSCNILKPESLEALNDIERGPSCYVSKRKNWTVL